VITRRTLTVGLAVALLVALVPASSTATTTFIQSPSHNIACQLDSHSGALCTVLSLQRQASVSQRGHVRVFAQNSNPPSGGVRTLRYGHSIRLGKVRCTSLRRGMRCTQVRRHHGFIAFRSGFRTF
jgi:hypothetical protein